jgi:hypothetical protein
MALRKRQTDRRGFDSEEFTEATETSTVTKTAKIDAAHRDSPRVRQIT